MGGGEERRGGRVKEGKGWCMRRVGEGVVEGGGGGGKNEKNVFTRNTSSVYGQRSRGWGKKYKDSQRYHCEPVPGTLH